MFNARLAIFNPARGSIWESHDISIIEIEDGYITKAINHSGKNDADILKMVRGLRFNSLEDFNSWIIADISEDFAYAAKYSHKIQEHMMQELSINI